MKKLFLIIIMVTIFIVGFFIGKYTNPKITGNIIYNESGAFTVSPVYRNPNFSIINNQICLNQEDPWGLAKAKCTISIGNLENEIPIQFQPEFKCFKLSDQNPKFITADLKAIPSKNIEEFTITYDNDGREWSCIINDPKPNKIINGYEIVKT